MLSSTLQHVQATLSLGRLSHERPEYLWLTLNGPLSERGALPRSEACGELRVRLQWTPAPLSTADAGLAAGCVTDMLARQSACHRERSAGFAPMLHKQ